MKITNITRDSYATDGRCHNANIGTFGHECGKPATWIASKANGFRSGFCSHCKVHGDEAKAFVCWEYVKVLKIDRIA